MEVKDLLLIYLTPRQYAVLLGLFIRLTPEMIQDTSLRSKREQTLVHNILVQGDKQLDLIEWIEEH